MLQNLYSISTQHLDKVCRSNLNYSDEICDALAKRNPNATGDEQEYEYALGNVTYKVTSINSWKYFIGKFSFLYKYYLLIVVFF